MNLESKIIMERKEKYFVETVFNDNNEISHCVYLKLYEYPDVKRDPLIVTTVNEEGSEANRDEFIFWKRMDETFNGDEIEDIFAKS